MLRLVISLRYKKLLKSVRNLRFFGLVMLVRLERSMRLVR